MKDGRLPPRSDGEARPGSARGAELLPLPQIRKRVDRLPLVPVGDLAAPDLEVEMCAELGRPLAVIVRRGAADREDVTAGQPGRGPRADPEEGRAAHRRALARDRVEAGNGKPEQRSEAGRQAEDDGDRDPRLRGWPDEVSAADAPRAPGDSHRPRSD